MCAQDGDVEGGKTAEDLKDELLGSGDVVLVEAAFASLRVHLYKSGMFWTFLDYPKELEIST